jgi:hypothetical protein
MSLPVGSEKLRPAVTVVDETIAAPPEIVYVPDPAVICVQLNRRRTWFVFDAQFDAESRANA